jgi:hypothetical protein
MSLNQQRLYALAHPVFDPKRQITPGHFWLAERAAAGSSAVSAFSCDRWVSAGLTVNIGME